MLRPLEKIASDASLDDPQRDAMRIVRASWLRLLALVTEMGRIAGRPDMSLSGRSTIDLRAHLEAALTYYQGIAAQEMVHLRYQLGEKLGIATLDVTQLDLILDNLLSNLVRHSQQGATPLIVLDADPTVGLSLLTDIRPATISQENLERLSLFFEAPPANELARRGIEIMGLALHRIGGRLDIPADRGGLSIGIPAILALEVSAISIADDLTDDPDIPSDAERILVVEDDPNMRALLVDTLQPVAKRHGLGVVAVASATAARRYIEFKAVRLIVSDIRMPAESGLALGEWLRAHDTMQNTPVIYVTAYDDPQTEAAVFRLRGVDLLIKPFSPEDLRRKADALLMASLHGLKSAPSGR